MKYLLIFIGVGFIVFACRSPKEIPVSNAPLKQQISEFLSSCEEKGFNGSVLVSVADSIFFSSGYGYNSKEKQVRNTSTTIFDIGSITKQFTAAAILVLEMNGKLRVEDQIGTYIPQLNEEKSRLTLHQLLTHTAGLKGALGSDLDLVSSEDFIKLVNESSFKHDPGEKYSYSNVGYSLLGIAIERITQKSYEEFLREALFLPAGMTHTGYVLPNWKQANLAMGYRDGDLPTAKNWNAEGPGWHLKGNGGILSHVEDMYAWHNALLGNKILNEAARKKLYTKHTPEDGGNSYYGYGWAIFPTKRKTDLIAHNGGNGIFFADFHRMLEEEVVFIVMSNRADDNAEELGMNLYRMVFN